MGFTYKEWERKYYLIKEWYGHGLCLACMKLLQPKINVFCYRCKAPRPLDWTMGNKSLDSFIMESWSNVENDDDTYIQWIEYSLLMNVQKMTLLRHGCTHIADLTMNGSTRVTLKMIESFDFHQVNYLRVNNAMQSIIIRVFNID